MSRTTRLSARAAAGLLLLLVTSWVLLLATPAAARPTDFAITGPQRDAVVAAPVEITGWVDRTDPPPPEAPGPVEEVYLLTRLQNADNEQLGKERPLELVEITDTGPGAQRMSFRGVLDPWALAWPEQPVIAPNGVYTLQAQWLLRYGDQYSERADDWVSVPLTLNVPPPATSAVAGVRDAATRQVEVAWRPVELPDLVGYRVEVTSDGENWTVAQDDIGGDTTSIVVEAPDYGTYAYRVAVRRLAADGSELETLSEQSNVVELTETAPPQPVDDGVDDGDGKSGGDDDGDGSGRKNRNRPGVPPVLVPNPLPQATASPAPATPAPTFAAPPGANDSYDPLIDYGVELPSEGTERVAIAPPVDNGGGPGGLLSIDTQGTAGQILRGVAGGLVLLLAAGHVVRFLNA